MTGLVRRFSLEGKAAVVTGGGMGIGRAIALSLAEAGAAVMVQDLKEEAAAAVAAGIAEEGGRALHAGGDVTSLDVVRETLERTRRDLGRLDVLVNNAGIYPFAPLLDLPLEQWDQVLNVNLRAVFVGTQLAGRMMAELGNGGRIVNLASVQAFRPGGPGLAHYNTTKAAVRMLTKTAALELAPHRITVNAVAPGVIETPGTQPLLDANALGQPAERVPLGRWGTPEDVADVVLFLAGPAAGYVTGETVIVDGGFLLR